tara:strand:+ start:90 stop:335 length:246 start_codon:yes stop_codon:yes gene_type:complete
MTNKKEVEVEVEVTSAQHNDKVFSEMKALEDKIKGLKETLKPIELPRQAGLNECNALARKALSQPIKVDPKLLAEDSKPKK